MEYILCSFVALIICQIIKFLVEFAKTGKPNYRRLMAGSGGMPSAHASFTSAASMLIYFEEGFSAIFAFSFIVTLVISYDAMGVRNESSKHAKALNELFKNPKKFKEQIGHEPIEVIAGLVLGSVVAYIFSKFVV